MIDLLGYSSGVTSWMGPAKAATSVTSQNILASLDLTGLTAIEFEALPLVGNYTSYFNDFEFSHGWGN